MTHRRVVPRLAAVTLCVLALTSSATAATPSWTGDREARDLYARAISDMAGQRIEMLRKGFIGVTMSTKGFGLESGLKKRTHPPATERWTALFDQHARLTDVTGSMKSSGTRGDDVRFGERWRPGTPPSEFVEFMSLPCELANPIEVFGFPWGVPGQRFLSATGRFLPVTQRQGASVVRSSGRYRNGERWTETAVIRPFRTNAAKLKIVRLESTNRKGKRSYSTTIELDYSEDSAAVSRVGRAPRQKMPTCTLAD